ncbi:MAG TPA: hypothetical protein VGQ08_16995 [Nitrospiraceae bacterium]|jgi:hypothetical protein|nr:hypothetical protein [Nitrospiraceae bacterium]
MNNLMLGVVLGSLLTGSLGLAGTFYDSKGQPNAPQGSIQQFDYFRQRQLFLDTAAQRRLAERPCAR